MAMPSLLMAEKNNGFRLHVTIHPEKHPATYAALKSIDQRARSSRLMQIAESSLEPLTSSRATAPEPAMPSGAAHAPSSVDDLGSLLGFMGGDV